MEDQEYFHEKMVEKYGSLHLPSAWVYKKANKSGKLVYGHGLNDVEFSCQPQIAGKQFRHPGYEAWVSLLSRCYSDTSNKRSPTYKEVRCSEDWHTFSNFLLWFNTNYIPGYALDKDLKLRNNKIYSADTSMYIPKAINAFLTTRKNHRGVLPLGVSLNRGLIVATISLDGEQRQIGTFKTPEEAHKAWQELKIKQTYVLKQRYILPQLQLVIDRLQHDYDNSLITEVI